MRNVRNTAVLLAVALLTGCGAFGPKLDVEGVAFDWDFLPIVSGRIINSGGKARYVELAIKLTHPDNPDHIYMTGWTNFNHFDSGENRPFAIHLTGERPTGDFKYYWRVATKPGGAMY